MKNTHDFYQPRSDYRHGTSLYRDSEMRNTHPVEQITGFVVQSTEDSERARKAQMPEAQEIRSRLDWEGPFNAKNKENFEFIY